MNMHDSKKMNGDLSTDMGDGSDIEGEIERELNALTEKDIAEWDPENTELQDATVDNIEEDDTFEV